MLSPPPLLLAVLLLLQARVEPGPSPRPAPGWQPPVGGSEWLAALDAANGNGSTSPPATGAVRLCASGGSCDLKLLRLERMEVVRLKVLSELGLEEPPVGRGRHVTNEFRQRVLSEQTLVNKRNRREPKLQPENAETEAILTLAKQSPLADHSSIRGSPLAAETIYFELPRDLTARSLGGARILLRPGEQGGPLVYTRAVTYVNIYKVVPQGLSFQLEEVTTETVQPKTASSEFASIDVTELVYDWLRKPGTNYGLVIRTRDQHGAGSSALFNSMTGAGSPPDDTKVPLLEINIDKNTAKRRRWRRRRRAPPIRYCDPNGRETNCCLYELVVDFYDFSWDWIIAPVSYHANFCRGDCPAVFMQKLAHTHIAQQLGGSVGPCCSPHQLAPLWMIYWDTKNNIKWAEIPGMRVRSCGCH